jgi:hypothetical protein
LGMRKWRVNLDFATSICLPASSVLQLSLSPVLTGESSWNLFCAAALALALSCVNRRKLMEFRHGRASHRALSREPHLRDLIVQSAGYHLAWSSSSTWTHISSCIFVVAFTLREPYLRDLIVQTFLFLRLSCYWYVVSFFKFFLI